MPLLAGATMRLGGKKTSTNMGNRLNIAKEYPLYIPHKLPIHRASGRYVSFSSFVSRCSSLRSCCIAENSACRITSSVATR